MYDFLRRPAWILSHVLVAIGVVAMIGLGFWQRQRWIDERAKSEALQAEASATAVPLDRVLADAGVRRSTAPSEVPDSVDFRRVELTGTYDGAHEVMIRNRSRDGAPGGWVMTPLVREDGTRVAVVRGWVPLDVDPPAPPFPGSEPPTGPVTVTGIVQRSQVRDIFGASDPASGTLRSLTRVDVPRLAQQAGGSFEPVYVLLDGQTPPQGVATKDMPAIVQLQVPTPETNFSYMVQWWIFATIALLGYPLVLRRVARNRARGDETPGEDAPPPPLPGERVPVHDVS
ncbi:MAG: SURF1 family protein [Actinobacteria bacterium]|nr:SURF1 family protein [Actinomycetota bacterium]